MFRRVSLVRSGDGYVLTLTPTQCELVRRVVLDLYGGGHAPAVVAVVAGDEPAELRELKSRTVDFCSRTSIEVVLGEAGLRAVCGALSFAFLNRSSEEAFHTRYGFYSENVQAVGWAIFGALQEMRDEAG